MDNTPLKKHSYFAQTFDGYHVGAEFELESVKHMHFDVLDDLNIRVEEDGSLRNGGREFITAPVKDNQKLRSLHKKILAGEMIEFCEMKDVCSDRCSTHIHVNVTDLSLGQVKNLIYVYYLIEPLVYNFIAPERLHNIYCVPLSWTFLPHKFERVDVIHLASLWSKYTGFNIKNIQEGHGTIEWRHLEATQDTDKFGEWLEIIKRWYDYGIKNEITLDSLKNIDKIVYSIFTNSQGPNIPMEDYLENQIIDLKLAFLQPETKWK